MNQIRIANIDEVIDLGKISKNYKITRNMDKEMKDVWEAFKYCVDHYLPYIVFANDVLKVPPTKTFLELFRQMHSVKNKGMVEFSDNEDVQGKILKESNVEKEEEYKFAAKDAQKIGAVWGYVFQEILGYKRVEKPVRINTFGVKAASVFEKEDAGKYGEVNLERSNSFE